MVGSLDPAVFISKAFMLCLPSIEFHLLFVVCHGDQQSGPNIEANSTSIFFLMPVKCYLDTEN